MAGERWVNIKWALNIGYLSHLGGHSGARVHGRLRCTWVQLPGASRLPLTLHQLYTSPHRVFPFAELNSKALMVMVQTEREPDIALGGDTGSGELAANPVDQLQPSSDPKPPIRIAHVNHDNTPNMTGMDELVRLMRTQTELTERLLAKAENKADNVAKDLPPSSGAPAGDVSREILDVLRRIDERQRASGMLKTRVSILSNL